RGLRACPLLRLLSVFSLPPPLAGPGVEQAGELLHPRRGQQRCVESEEGRRFLQACEGSEMTNGEGRDTTREVWEGGIIEPSNHTSRSSCASRMCTNKNTIS